VLRKHGPNQAQMVITTRACAFMAYIWTQRATSFKACCADRVSEPFPVNASSVQAGWGSVVQKLVANNMVLEGPSATGQYNDQDYGTHACIAP
jgi:hypothetical protein